jgi:enolase-phosphatase E1
MSSPRHGISDGISHVLLDIEGTTCPVNFVAETLFPYATYQLDSFLQEQASNPDVGRLLHETLEAWKHDSNDAARALWDQHFGADASPERNDPNALETAVQPGSASVSAYLKLLIAQDRKLTSLKDLQGMIWAKGYANGDLVAPLFKDVPAALQQWHEAGLVLAVYSSGSVAAQQLLYGHTSWGDLRPLFSHWFDTRTGAKQDRQSYAAISDAMGVPAEQVLFISDALAECNAAHESGMHVLFSDRPGNPQRDSGSFERICTYTGLTHLT